MNIIGHHRIARRTLLRAGAVAIALPLLEAMSPLTGAEAGQSATTTPPRRMVLIHRPLGTYHPYLVPEQTGRDYTATRFLQKIERHRARFTVFSGMGHVGYPNSHGTEPAIFTGVKHFNEKDLHNSISLDQVVMKQIGQHTRYPHLVLNSVWSQSLSWNEKGVPTPHEDDVAALFRRLFITGTPDEVQREIRRLQHGRSILDDVRTQFAALNRDLGAADRQRVDVLATSIREAETQLTQDEAWAARPKPVVAAKPAEFDRTDNWVTNQGRWFALMHLALQTDSTRVIVIGLNEHNAANQGDLSIQHHDASHHGKDPAKIEQLARYEDKDFTTFGEFLDRLAGTDENGRALLDSTQVLFTSNLGDASAHASTNLPVLLAGGGYRHQGHIAFDRENNMPLSNLYLRMLHHQGIAAESFGSSTGVLSELQ